MVSQFYDLTCLDRRGNTYSFSELKDKVVLIVNVASKCGFTPQYDGLQKLYDEFKDRDFIVLGFPCNQFKNQEPGTEDEIAHFCKLNFGVTFPLMKKIEVNGEDEDPVYKYLKAETAGASGPEDITWNFEKFLIDREGKVFKRYAPKTEPAQIESDIKALVGA